MAETIVAVNVRLPPVLLGAIDEMIAKGVYSSRSELIRDMCRNYVLENRHLLDDGGRHDNA